MKSKCTLYSLSVDNKQIVGGRRDRARMVVGFTTTCAISA
jgi:hypothetical protein